ncbi:PrgI family protein [Candidatus Woesebacteria bacterium]|nr:PrgI family protein [Candidatus Woesebacteria bacterium]
MQQHPIPQDITGYRFHIVGSMTLKQFGEILLSVIIAFIIFSTNLLAIIKWPLILLTITIGIVAAFVPIQEKPLTHWISTFVKVMYKPTKFFWKREINIPEFFLFESLATTIVQEPEIDLTPAKRQRIKEYLGSVPETSSFSTDFTQDEVDRMQGILASFNTVQTTTVVVKQIKTEAHKPSLDVRVRSMRAPKIADDQVDESNQINEEEFVEPESMFEKKVEEHDKNEKSEKVRVGLSPDQVAQNIQIPEQSTITLTTQQEEKERDFIDASATDMSEKVFMETESPEAINIGNAHDVNFNSDLPFPIKPNKPNKLVGMVLSKTNDLLSDSIVEVQTLEGAIERAVKTNALGQFFITTPLKNGEYSVKVEKEGYIFQPLHISINGTIIQPIEIRSEN